MLYRYIYDIEGIVQGVGFRPKVYCLAVNAGLGGWIKNCSGKVELALEGDKKEILRFIKNFEKNLPDQAKLKIINLKDKIEINKRNDFVILESEADTLFKISIPADLTMCKDCEGEINDPKNRRYNYAFTTCVNCGPRYTVVNSMPYDRCRTTLENFPLCKKCEKEYTDPRNRRFHAESIACPVCGPKLFLADCNGKILDEVLEPIEKVKEYIKQGDIIAIRGIGGFLLAADALNIDSLKKLRERKNRPDKPFAVMVSNVNILRKYCFLSRHEEELVKSSRAPIVILKRKDLDDKYTEAMNLLSPDTATLGVMLPYSPMHRLLFKNADYDILIMTSANRGGEPICIKNDEAFERLKGIADYFLCHDREINLRNDDSLCILNGGKEQVWRRARGYAPEAIRLNKEAAKNILSMGAELKNTVTLLIKDDAIISPHIGDLETPEAVNGLEETLENFTSFFMCKPEIIVVDKHPDMHSTRIGIKSADKYGAKILKVQHHHAHAVSCMGENNLNDAFALVFDGTGLGDDGNIWGAEALYVNEEGFERFGTFKPVRLPGGDIAIAEPKRQLIGRFISAEIEPDSDTLAMYDISDTQYSIWKTQCNNNINSPLTHAAGRLFDSYSVFLGISPNKVTYEGQAAIRLENYAKKAVVEELGSIQVPYTKEEYGDIFYVNWNNAFKYLYKEFLQNPRFDLNVQCRLALGFHEAVADVAVEMVKFGKNKYNSGNIVLSGGVFMNTLLTALVKDRLRLLGLKVYIHSKVPPNDGGVSFGQAIIASKIYK